MSSFYQILVAVAGGVAALAALIKAGPVVWKAGRGLGAWADVQPRVEKVITETVPALAAKQDELLASHSKLLASHSEQLAETKLLRGELGDHVTIETDAIKVIRETAEQTAKIAGRTAAIVAGLETAGVAKANAERIIEAVGEVREEQKKQNGGGGIPASE